MYRSLTVCFVFAFASALAGLSMLAAADDKKETSQAVVLFNGKDLTGWKLKGPESKSKWVVGRAALDEKNPVRLAVMKSDKAEEQHLINTAGSVDIYTEQKFGDGTFEVEFMIPKGSNSGVYVLGEYEVQILDSFGKEKLSPGDMGGIYTVAAPKVNACKKPGEWQKLVIEYRAPRFEGDKKIDNVKFVKVTLNDQIIHENVEAKGPTGGSLVNKESATGPLLLQGDHGPAAFRSIKFIPRVAKVEARP